jgi:hypothetical protein
VMGRCPPTCSDAGIGGPTSSFHVPRGGWSSGGQCSTPTCPHTAEATQGAGMWLGESGKCGCGTERTMLPTGVDMPVTRGTDHFGVLTSTEMECISSFSFVLSMNSNNSILSAIVVESQLPSILNLQTVHLDILDM